MTNLFFYCKFGKLQLRLTYFLADYVQTGYGAFSETTIDVVKFCSLRLRNHNFCIDGMILIKHGMAAYFK